MYFAVHTVPSDSNLHSANIMYHASFLVGQLGCMPVMIEVDIIVRDPGPAITVVPLRRESSSVAIVIARTNHFIDACRTLWRELHAEQHATPEWFADWCTRVPSFDCGCQSWLTEYLVGHPPRYDDFYEWGVECHDAVNAKLGKPDWDHVAQST